jgi:hypothetical protein
MTTTVEQKRRELFESVLKDHYYLSELNHSWPMSEAEYFEPEVQIAFEVFNAALDAVVIQMPECDPGEVIQYGFAVEDFRESIQSTGLGLKVMP